jgi:hypothetical protein
MKPLARVEKGIVDGGKNKKMMSSCDWREDTWGRRWIKNDNNHQI